MNYLLQRFSFCLILYYKNHDISLNETVFSIRHCYLKVETEIKHEMIEALKDGFKNDTITTEHSISNAWNHLFMKVSVF